MKDLQGFVERLIAFSAATFGPANNNTAGILDHIEKEIKEVRSCGGADLSEWVDIIILAIDGAWRAGFTAEEICIGLNVKQQINMKRKWPDWRTAAPGKAIEHIRDEDICGDGDA